MWAGVRLGLQILRVCLWWAGRFDSDSLPPLSLAGLQTMAGKRRLKPFRATKEVKRRARLLVGTPPPVRREESPKRKPPKHKKLELQREKELL
jgi:hypothetical protein